MPKGKANITPIETASASASATAVMRHHYKPTCRSLDVQSVSEVTVECYSVDDSSVPSTMMTKPVMSKRTSWGRIKKIIADNTGMLSKRAFDDGSGKKSKRGSLDLDYEPIVNMRNKDGTSRKLSNPVMRRSPRGHHAYSLENMLQVAILESNEVAMMKLIQDHKVDVNFVHEIGGSNALHQACVLGNVSIIKTLLKNGADVGIRTCSGLSALQIATLHGHFDAAQYLIEHGACSKDIQDGISSDQTKLSYSEFLY